MNPDNYREGGFLADGTAFGTYRRGESWGWRRWNPDTGETLARSGPAVCATADEAFEAAVADLA